MKKEVPHSLHVKVKHKKKLYKWKNERANDYSLKIKEENQVYDKISKKREININICKV